MDDMEWDGHGLPGNGVTVEFVPDDTQSPQGWVAGDLVKVLDFVDDQPICWNATAGNAVLVRRTQIQMSPSDVKKADRSTAVSQMMAYYQPLLEDSAVLFAFSLYDAGFRAPAQAPGDDPDIP